MKRDKKRLSYLLTVSLCLVFTFSIGIKAVYNTALVEIRAEYNLTNFETQIGSFIYYGVYAISQIVLGLRVKKFNVKKIFFLSIILTAVCYCCMMFAGKAWILWLLMGLSGVFSAPHWMGCIYFISKLLKGKYLQRATSVMAIANPLGTAIASGVVALFIYLNQWKISFVVLGLLMVFSAFIFKYSETNLEKCLNDGADNGLKNDMPSQKRRTLTKQQKKIVWFTIVLFFVIQILLGGAYTIAKQTLSLFLFDVCGLDKSLSVLLTLFLPIMAMTLKLLLYKIYFKHKNFLIITLIGEAIAILCAFGLLFVYQSSIIMGLILYVLLYSFTLSGATMLGGSIFGLSIKDKVNSGTSSAVLNAGLSVGCAVLPLISGAILDLGGTLAWNTLFIFIAGTVFLVELILLGCFITRKKNYTFSSSDQNNGR